MPENLQLVQLQQRDNIVMFMQTGVDSGLFYYLINETDDSNNQKFKKLDITGATLYISSD